MHLCLFMFIVHICMCISICICVCICMCICVYFGVCVGAVGALSWLSLGIKLLECRQLYMSLLSWAKFQGPVSCHSPPWTGSFWGPWLCPFISVPPALDVGADADHMPGQIVGWEIGFAFLVI